MSDMNSTSPLTFEQFQATRREVSDLGDALGEETLSGQPGYLYLGELHIAFVTADWPPLAQAEGRYHLQIGRDEEITDDLAALERNLWEFAISEGYGDNIG